MIYDYYGNPFTDIGNGSVFSTADRLRARVQFYDAPAPNARLVASDIEAFTLSAGKLATDLREDLVDESWFQFDANGQLQQWLFGAGHYTYEDGIVDLQDFRTENSDNVVVDQAGFAIIPFDVFDMIADTAEVRGSPGVWILVPEPSMIVLWSLMGVAGIAVGCRRNCSN
ncbi:MAG: hypothetical protein ACYC6N_11845 [Pirellulaceae bacterium]